MTYQIFGDHDQKTLHQFHEVRKRAVRAALMADGHLGYVMPVGGVAAYDGQVSMVGVGVDIACGNCAIRTDLVLADLDISLATHPSCAQGMIEDEPWRILESEPLIDRADEIAAAISFGVGRSNLADDAPVDAPLFEDDRWLIVPKEHREKLRSTARHQLGTVGGGNHYVDVFVDQDDAIWVGVHFGSRRFGYDVYNGFNALAQGAPWGSKKPEREVLLDLDSDLGERYWAMMELAGEYAYAGREWVARKVVELLGGEEKEMVHNHHNFAWREAHWTDDGYHELVVIRKGATPAWPGELGFVGGSMGDEAVILMGTNARDFSGDVRDLQRRALYSTVHGAGRVMGRAAAKRGEAIRDERGVPTGERDLSTKITRDEARAWTDEKGVIVRGGDVDEAPQAYRRLYDVLAAQAPTIEVVSTLRPIIVCMAPTGTRRDDRCWT